MKQLKERFDTLSDAIIAIVMTVLVLEIAVPATTRELPHLLEQIFLFLVSFVIITNFWYRRFQAMRATEKVTFRSFTMDVIAHAILALYPLATKILIEFPVKWMAIAFFAAINLLTAFLLNCMTYELANQAVKPLAHQDSDRIHLLYHWMRRRIVIGLLASIVLMCLSLYFNSVLIYILSPFLEFISHVRRGRAMEEAFREGQSFKDIVAYRDRKSHIK